MVSDLLSPIELSYSIADLFPRDYLPEFVVALMDNTFALQGYLAKTKLRAIYINKPQINDGRRICDYRTMALQLVTLSSPSMA